MENGNFHRFSFGLADYALLGVVVSVSIVIGLYHAFRRGDQKTVSEYLVGNRKMKVVPVAVSLLVTFQSSTLLIGLPAEMYVYGTMLWLFVLTAISANTLSAIFIVPLFQPLKLTSAYEYLELRFESRWVRRLGSILGILGNTWYCGVVLYGPAIVIESVTGTPIWASIIIMAASGIFYTSIGGYKAVIWTDVFQFTVMISGMLAVIIKGAMSVGGLGEMWRIAEEGRRIQFFNFNPDPTVRNTFWCLVIGGTVKKFGYNLSQSAIQRMSSMETVRKAQGMVLLAIPGFVLFGTLACLEGLLAYAYFAKSGCDPLEAKIIKSPNEVIPYFVMELFHTLPGVPGLFLSSVFCAALSSLSSCLNGISAMVSEDFVLPFYPQIRERTRTIMAKLTVLVFGLLSVGVAFLASHTRGPLYQIASVLMSSFGGALTGLFLLGALFSSVNSKGAVVGGLFGFAFSFWVSLGGAFSENIPRTPYLRSPGTEFCSREINHHFNYTQVRSINTTKVPPFSDLYNSTYVPEVTDFSAFNNTDSTHGFNSTSSCTTVSPLLKLYSLSYMWLYALAVLLTLITGIITSYITGANKKGDVDPKYLISFRDKISACLPQSRKPQSPNNHVDKELIVGFSTPPSGSDSCPGRGEDSRDRLLSHPNGSASAKL